MLYANTIMYASIYWCLCACELPRSMQHAECGKTPMYRWKNSPASSQNCAWFGGTKKKPEVLELHITKSQFIPGKSAKSIWNGPLATIEPKPINPPTNPQPPHSVMLSWASATIGTLTSFVERPLQQRSSSGRRRFFGGGAGPAFQVWSRGPHVGSTKQHGSAWLMIHVNRIQ